MDYNHASKLTSTHSTGCSLAFKSTLSPQFGRLSSEVGLIVLNFAHPLTAEQLHALEALTQQSITRVIDAPAQFDQDRDFVSQAAVLADACGLSAVEWQTLPLLIIPPALSAIAVTLLAELHGRMGYFPACVRLRPVPGAMPLRFEVAEILSLNEVREAARSGR